MRDHHFQMFSQRAFLTWRERHIVKFSFANKKHNCPPLFLFPLPYSTRVQRVPSMEAGEPDAAASAATSAGGRQGAPVWFVPIRLEEGGPVEWQAVAWK